MQCNSVRPGYECLFMSKAGCTFEGGVCRPVVDDCLGCEHVSDFRGETFCVSYPDPEYKWKLGMCNFATHRKAAAAEAAGKFVNPLKAAKRAAKNKG